ncbi:MAG: RES domain-containing protein [Bifidobacteriaceae bacterium]|nr:RES domain-containing protein [Bifidobacteriaceae bacterium]
MLLVAAPLARASSELASFVCDGAPAVAFADPARKAIARFRDLLEVIEVAAATEKWSRKARAEATRALIAFFTLADVLGVGGSPADDGTWCAALRDVDDDLKDSCPSFAPSTSHEMTRRILVDHLADAEDSFTALCGPPSTILSATIMVRLTVSASQIRARYCADKDALPPELMTLLSEDEARRELGMPELKDVRDMVRHGELLAVTLWTGEVWYPAFQFHFGAVCPEIAEVLPKIVREWDPSRNNGEGRPAGLHGWELALFLHHHHLRFHEDPDVDDAGTIEELLSAVNLLESHVRALRTRSLDTVKEDPSKASIWPCRRMHRVKRVKDSAVRYSTYTKSPPDLRVGVGRLDLPGPEDKPSTGTWYIADTPTGAWREVLDQSPVLTLDAILTRERVELKATRFIRGIARLTGGRAALTSARRRADTLDVAKRIAEQGYRGIKYCLSKERSGNGFALFGPTTAKHPGDPGADSWKLRKRSPALQDRYLREALDWREKNEPYPVILRRFPPTPKWMLSDK